MSAKKLTIEKLKLSKKTMAVVAAGVALVGVAALIISRAATVGPNLGFYMTTTNATPGVGTTFDVKLYANTGTTPVKSVAALVNYDPTQLRPDIVASAPKADPLATPPVDGFDETLSCGPANGCRTDTGNIVFSLLNTGTSRRSGDGIYIGTIRFTALKTGVANITYAPNGSQPGQIYTGFTNPDSATTQATLDTRVLQNISVSATDITAPSPPSTSLVSPTKGITTINLSWGVSSDEASGSGLAGYKVYRNIGTTPASSTATPIASPTTNSFQDSGLSPSTTYTYTVKAYDNAGNHSTVSNSLTVITNADTVIPSTPGQPVVPTGGVITQTSIPLTWTISTDNIAVAGYKVFRNGGATPVATVTANTYTDNGRAPNTAYTYTIKAYDTANPANDSLASVSNTLTTARDILAPTIPNLSSATPSANTVLLTWTGSTDDLAVAGYNVLRNGAPIGTTTSTVLTFTDTPPQAGTFTYTISAFDAAGNVSQASQPKTATIYSRADLDRNGLVGISDLSIVLSKYGVAGTAGDANGDGAVDIRDISTLLTLWGTAG